MVREVIVLQIEAQKTFVMDKSGGVYAIVTKPGLEVGQAIYVFEEDFIPSTPRREEKKPSYGRWFAPLLAVAVIVLIIGQFLRGTPVPVQASFLSIGQSSVVELEYGDDLRIKDIQGVDGTSSVEGALLEQLTRFLEQNPPVGDENVVISYTPMPSELEEAVRTLILDYYQAQGYEGDIIYIEITPEEAQAAHTNDRSMIDYTVESRSLQLWSRREVNNLTQEEKSLRLGTMGYVEERLAPPARPLIQPESIQRLPSERYRLRHNYDVYDDNDWDDDDWDDDDWDDDDWDDDDWDDDWDDDDWDDDDWDDDDWDDDDDDD